MDNTLQKLLENTLQTAFSMEAIIASILNKKLKEMGIVLSDEQLQQLQKEIKSNKNLDTLSFKIDEEKALQSPSDLKGKSNALISLTIDAEKDLADLNDKIGDLVENLIPHIACEAAEIILETLRKHFREHQQYNRGQITNFNRSLRRRG